MEKLRLDKYLWAIRLFKTRSQVYLRCYRAGHPMSRLTVVA